MERRRFLQQGLAAGTVTLLSASVFANNTTEKKPFAEKPFQLNYGIHDGMFKENAGASFLD